VIKNLGRFYRHVKVVSGATILGDGRVALILDPERVAQDAVRAIAHGTRAGPSVAAIAAAVKQSLRERSAAPKRAI
jgi:two-component system chemotaxis sensor kinase CheA